MKQRSILHRARVASVAAAALLAAAGAGTRVHAQAAAGKDGGSQQVQIGDTIITSEQLEYDLDKKQYVFSGGKKVELTSKTSHMTSDKMTVEMDDQNELKWSKCEGHVFVERKNLDDGTLVKGWGNTMEYFASQNKAYLEGNVTVHQDSPRLAKPAVITGSRVDMDLDSGNNIVHRSPEAQAKVHVEPKGNDPKAAPPGAASVAAPKPEPEPVDLVGDRIDMNSKTQEYVAVGHPVMVRPSSRLQAKRIRFTVDPKTNDVKVAYADDDVVFDGKNDKGAVMHSTGDKGSFDHEISLLKMDGNVHALAKDPDSPDPTLYECGHFEYNTKTGKRTMRDHVIVKIPPKTQVPGDQSASGGDKTKPDKSKAANGPKSDSKKPATDKPDSNKPKSTDQNGDKQ